MFWRGQPALSESLSMQRKEKEALFQKIETHYFQLSKDILRS